VYATCTQPNVNSLVMSSVVNHSFTEMLRLSSSVSAKISLSQWKKLAFSFPLKEATSFILNKRIKTDIVVIISNPLKFSCQSLQTESQYLEDNYLDSFQLWMADSDAVCHSRMLQTDHLTRSLLYTTKLSTVANIQTGPSILKSNFFLPVLKNGKEERAMAPTPHFC